MTGEHVAATQSFSPLAKPGPGRWTIERILRGLWWRTIGRLYALFVVARQKRRELYREYPIIKGLGANPATRGKAFLALIVEPFLPSRTDAGDRRHANHWRSTEIVKILADFGFSVDVTDWRNMHTPKADNYDIVLGSGRAFEQCCRRRRRQIPCIFLGWGRPATAVAAAFEERSRKLLARRGVHIRQEYPANDAARYATEVWYQGDSATAESYRSLTDGPFWQLSNNVVDGVRSTLDGKSFSVARNHFMWMASYGTLLRGLDLLLEVFEMLPDYDLWVCGGLEHEKSFFSYYGRQLHELPNIHYVGWVDVAGERYQEITRRCGFFIYPTASDGMPGSVINAMASGLVPIVTAEAGIDCGGFAIAIPKMDCEVIRRVIEEVAATNPSILEVSAHQVAAFAVQRYSKETFRRLFRERVAAVVSQMAR